MIRHSVSIRISKINSTQDKSGCEREKKTKQKFQNEWANKFCKDVVQNF